MSAQDESEPTESSNEVLTHVIRAGDRGRTHIDWLDSHHTFSFGEYYNPEAMGFRVLRVINDDRVAPGGGFPTHGHRDMEILSYVLEGGLEHRDSLGTGSVIRPGDVQRMSAGTGVRHSEFNASKTEPVHFLQIWLLPHAAGIAPGYEQKTFGPELTENQFRLVASPDGRDGSLTIHQDATLHTAKLEAGTELHQALGRHPFAYLHVARGELTLDVHATTAARAADATAEEPLTLAEGDGVAIAHAASLGVRAGTPGAEVLLFELP